MIFGAGSHGQLKREGNDLYFITVGHPRPLPDGYAEGRLLMSGASDSFYVGPADPLEAYALVPGDDGVLYVETTTAQAFVSYTKGQTWERAYPPDEDPRLS
jgi:hypothetical protein